MPTTTSTLLADPAQVAAVRELIQHARRHRAVHAIYSIGDGTGRAYGPREHTWDLGVARVAYDDGCLIYRRHGQRMLTARQVTSVRQVADLLAAIGVLPFAFASAYRVGQSDAAYTANVETPPAHRRCQQCGATSGLVMQPYGPLDPPSWKCGGGCRPSAAEVATSDAQSGR